MFDKNAIKQDFSNAAPAYDARAGLQKTILEQAYSFASDYFSGGSLVLDLGCGTGNFSHKENNWKVVGLDISYGMCVQARRKNPLIINAAAELLPFKDASLDCVFSSLMLQWAEKPEKVIQEILRVMNQDGIAVITSFVHGSLTELEQAFAAVDSSPHITPFAHAHYLLLQVAHNGGVMLEMEEKKYVQHHDNPLALMRSIKDIGAGNKLHNRRRGLMTPSQLKKMQDNYQAEDGKYPASWNVLTMVIGKS
jgi:malonyl-CoA O-methyltransferase